MGDFDVDALNADFAKPVTLNLPVRVQGLKELESLSKVKMDLKRLSDGESRLRTRLSGRSLGARFKQNEDRFGSLAFEVDGTAVGDRLSRRKRAESDDLYGFYRTTGGANGAAGINDFRESLGASVDGLRAIRAGNEVLSEWDMLGIDRTYSFAPNGRVLMRGGAVRFDESRGTLGKRLAAVTYTRSHFAIQNPVPQSTVMFTRPTRGRENWNFTNGIELFDLQAEPAGLSDQPIEAAQSVVPANLGSPPQYYNRPTFNGQPRSLTDLVSYAPGMSSLPADVRAVLEAEAAPRFGNKRGTIDPAARAMIDAARRGDWYTTGVGTGTDKVSFVHDYQGRYAYERRLASGLIERVLCDGSRVWHLYPELGVGAVRVVSRHHREFLLDVVPDFVPPADDLAVGSDVKKLDDNTIALVPILPASDDPPLAWVEIQLVFTGGRLAERRWVVNGTAAMKKEDLGLIAREVYGPAEVRLLGDDGKELSKAPRTIQNADAPGLAPDLSKLVVLPLPLRSREHTYHDLRMDAGQDLYQNQNACFEYMPPEAQLKLLACEFASNNGQNVGRVFDACFRRKGDQRPGFFTLLSSTNSSPFSWGLGVAFERNRTHPLLGYLYRAHDGGYLNWQARYGLASARMDATDFLGRLDAFRAITARWAGGPIGESGFEQRDAERERALEFVRANADNALGWAALGLVQDRCPNPAVWKQLAGVWGLVAQKSALKYQARYEEARCLGNAGDQNALAQKKYQDLFRDALKEGVLPPLDASFRAVLEAGDQGTWAALMRETAKLCAEKKARPVIVTLAWQCYQLGDVAMADVLLDAALDRVPDEEKTLTLLAAVHFLNATGRHDRADALVRELLAEEKLAKAPGLWRLASQVADNRQDKVRAIECLETALNLEFDRLPEVFDVQPIRNDYGRLIGHYEWLADAAKSLQITPPKDLLERVVRAADRWRHLDAEAGDLPNRVAALLRKVGGDDARALAWDYATTPLAVKPNESGPWVSLAAAARQEGDWKLADRCHAMAFAAEPTNAQLLWDRAAYLQQQGQVAESRKLYRQLADAEWQPRFSGLKAQARAAVQGR
jgi:hypothetical protein